MGQPWAVNIGFTEGLVLDSSIGIDDLHETHAGCIFEVTVALFQPAFSWGQFYIWRSGIGR
jgi:hypothetical protein